MSEDKKTMTEAAIQAVKDIGTPAIAIVADPAAKAAVAMENAMYPGYGSDPRVVAYDEAILNGDVAGAASAYPAFIKAGVDAVGDGVNRLADKVASGIVAAQEAALPGSTNLGVGLDKAIINGDLGAAVRAAPAAMVDSLSYGAGAVGGLAKAVADTTLIGVAVKLASADVSEHGGAPSVPNARTSGKQSGRE